MPVWLCVQEALREISVLKRLQHANVVALHEVIDDPTEDSFFMVQEVRPCAEVVHRGVGPSRPRAPVPVPHAL